MPTLSGSVGHASGVWWRWTTNPFFLFSLLGQPPGRNAPPTWQPGAGVWERSGRGLLAGGAGVLHRVRPSTHPARPAARRAPRPRGPEGTAARARLLRTWRPVARGSGRGCSGGCFLVRSSPSGGEREPAEAGAGGAGGGGGRDAKAGASRTGRSCSPGRRSAGSRRRDEPRALRRDGREPTSPPRARNPAPLLSTSGERAGGKEGRGRSLGGDGMAGRRGLGRCFSRELPPRLWLRRGLP